MSLERRLAKLEQIEAQAPEAIAASLDDLTLYVTDENGEIVGAVMQCMINGRHAWILESDFYARRAAGEAIEHYPPGAPYSQE